MKIREQLLAIKEEGSKVLVVGLGISGIESCGFFLKNDIKFLAVEKESRDNFFRKPKFKDQISALLQKGADLHFGIEGERLVELLADVKLAVLSPGVPLESPICAVLKRHAIPFISELELGVELRAMPAIVITGSNGKSTSVTLIDAIFREAGWNSELCGNVGLPVIAGAHDLSLPNDAQPNALLVVEASSYQLETCTLLKPRIASILNLSENHLERHGDMNRYLRIKARVFERQDASDLAVLNADDARVAALAPEINARLAAFGTQENNKLCENYARIRFEPSAGTDIIEYQGERFDLSEARLRGLHNRYNIALAIIAAREMGIAAESINKALRNFSPLEHRLEQMGEVAGIVCINDSKSTTVAATIAALSTVLSELGEKKITLMLGGLSKAGSWDPLCKQIAGCPQAFNRIICFGKDSGLIANYCKTFRIPHLTCASLSQAVEKGFTESGGGDVLLFSPGCASFDEFSDFEDRGRTFKQLVAARKP